MFSPLHMVIPLYSEIPLLPLLQLCPPFFLFLPLCLRKRCEKAEEAQIIHLSRTLSYRQRLEMTSGKQKIRKQKETGRRQRKRQKDEELLEKAVASQRPNVLST